MNWTIKARVKNNTGMDNTGMTISIDIKSELIIEDVIKEARKDLANIGTTDKYEYEILSVSSW